jgi:class 3 adenylate cyclase
MLDLLELTGLSAESQRQLAGELQQRHPRTGRLSQRVKDWLETLEAEGLVEATSHLGRKAYRASASGLQVLEAQGRYPGGAAVLFTDLVGSTALIGAHGEEEAHALRLRHFELLRGAVRTYGGREVKGLGDGLMVVFSSAAPAIACGAAMQRAVSADDDGLGLRVGIHVGPLLREHDDFHGTTVIIAARLCDKAQTGQVLVSDAAWLAAEDDPDPGPPVGEVVGDLDLKGLDHAVRTHQLNW